LPLAEPIWLARQCLVRLEWALVICLAAYYKAAEVLVLMVAELVETRREALRYLENCLALIYCYRVNVLEEIETDKEVFNIWRIQNYFPSSAVTTDIFT